MTNKRPLDVPLDELENALRYTTLKTSIDGDVLLVRHEKQVTKLYVVPGANPDAGDGRIHAVVKIETEVPAELRITQELAGVTNKFASLGSLVVEEARVYVGSRLTIYDGYEG